MWAEGQAPHACIAEQRKKCVWGGGDMMLSNTTLGVGSPWAAVALD